MLTEKVLPLRVHPGFAHHDGNEMAHAQLFAIVFGIHAFRGQRIVPTKGPGDSRMRGFVGLARLPTSRKASVFVLGTRAKFFGVYRLPTVSFPTWNVFLMSGPSSKRAEHALQPSFSRPASLSQIF